MKEFREFHKIPRLFRDIIITEKIDGTNAQLTISDDGCAIESVGSRKRFITPEDDNYGFAAWVAQNKDELLKLGPGTHFGEWWGAGIQRRYDMDRRVFSLFNVSRWREDRPECCDIVPILYEGPFNMKAVDAAMERLNHEGSVAAQKYGITYNNPEGIVIFHKEGNLWFKITLKDDNLPKSVVKDKYLGTDPVVVLLMEGGC